MQMHLVALKTLINLALRVDSYVYSTRFVGIGVSMNSSRLTIRESGIWTVGSSQRCVIWFWPLKFTRGRWRKCSSSYNINTSCAYLKNYILFALTSAATINCKCIPNLSFVNQFKIIKCYFQMRHSSGVCFPVKTVSGELCRNIQEEYTLCVQVQIYPQTECLIKVLLGKD